MKKLISLIKKVNPFRKLTEEEKKKIKEYDEESKRISDWLWI